jgi:hypothetical protein
MAARRTLKSFTSSKEKTKVEPIQFELEGETFDAYGQVPGAVLLDFIAASSQEDSTGTAGAILGYLKSSMDKETFKRFDKLTRDPEKIIELQVLADIVAYLIEERTNRPTE